MSDELLASQKAFYEERAPDYADPSKPADRRVRSNMNSDDVRALVDELAPAGDVLELACGTGIFTADIARHAHSVTAVDASPRMLEIARARVGDAKVTYVCGDIFAWEPDRTYDAVFFGFWLSHVPPSSFDDFWSLVRRCLAPHGRVGFVDEDDRGAGHDEVRSVEGVPVARRRLADGREFDIVKVFWRPDDLEGRLRSLGWDADVRRTGDTFLFGVAKPAAPGRTG